MHLSLTLARKKKNRIQFNLNFVTCHVYNTRVFYIYIMYIKLYLRFGANNIRARLKYITLKTYGYLSVPVLRQLIVNDNFEIFALCLVLEKSEKCYMYTDPWFFYVYNNMHTVLFLIGSPISSINFVRIYVHFLI